MTETKKTISVYIETEIQEEIQTRAKKENRTFSNMLNLILRKALFSGKKEK